MYWHWGSGPTLGLLTFVGYLAFITGFSMLWRGRNDIFLWFDAETSALRRNLSRLEPRGPFYSPREHSRLKTAPSHVVRTLSRVPRSRLSWAALLMFLGPILILLDFLV
jgi:hypothetical protein